jgi:hypothetical protein
MADYYTGLVVYPMIPKKYMADGLEKMLTALHIDTEPDPTGETLYLYASEYMAYEYVVDEAGNEVEHMEDDLVAAFQEIIKASNGEIPYITMEMSFSCSKMMPDGFGGAAAFITADDCEWINTGSWLEKKIAEMEV